MQFYFLLSIVLIRSQVSFIFFLFWHFSHWLVSSFFLQFSTLSHLSIMCLGVFSLHFSCLGLLILDLKLVVFHQSREVLAIISSNTFLPHSLLFLCDLSQTCILTFNIVPQVSGVLSSFSFSLLDDISWFLFEFIYSFFCCL